MTDEQATAPVTDPAPPATGAPGTEPTQGDGDWPTRMSGLQKAHNEETRVLREQLAAAEAAAARTTADASTATSTLSEEAKAFKAQAEAAQRALEAERKQRIVETRAVKYPYAAESLGDEGVLVTMDEARLAGLNARLTPSTGTPRLMDANGAARGAPVVEKPREQKTAAELKADLARLGPNWSEQVRESLG